MCVQNSADSPALKEVIVSKLESGFKAIVYYS